MCWYNSWGLTRVSAWLPGLTRLTWGREATEERKKLIENRLRVWDHLEVVWGVCVRASDTLRLCEVSVWQLVTPWGCVRCLCESWWHLEVVWGVCVRASGTLRLCVVSVWELVAPWGCVRWACPQSPGSPRVDPQSTPHDVNTSGNTGDHRYVHWWGTGGGSAVDHYWSKTVFPPS